ncbi:hypothetical protein ACOSP7_018093 [Xanthoceras sorbifolium]
MNRNIASLLVSMVGEIVELSNDLKDFWGKYLRVRVWVDVTKPLCRGLRVWVAEFGLMLTVLLKYECLSEFCHKCGMLGHPLRECMVEVHDGSELRFRSWLKATPHVRSKINGLRKFNTNRDNADSDFPRYHDGKFGFGKWEND